MKIEAHNTLLVESLHINDIDDDCLDRPMPIPNEFLEEYPKQTPKEVEIVLIVDGYTVSIKGRPDTTIELDRIIYTVQNIFQEGVGKFKEFSI